MSTAEKTMKDIELLITYGVEEEEKEVAMSYLQKVKENPVALAVLQDFYSTLPGAEEEPVVGLALLEARQGVYLLGVDAVRHKYLYFCSGEKAGCIGPFEEGISDPEVLAFFGLDSLEAFQKKYSSFSSLTEFGAESILESALCPVCGVAEGEFHELGCAVEICPWCDGQLSHCNCRFEQLEVEEFTTAAELEKFAELLEEKGRIRFSKEHAPAYPEDRLARTSHQQKL